MEQQAEEKIKVCPKCNKTFTCCTHDCWCSKLPNVMPMDVDAECYCPECLAEIIAKHSPIPAN